MSENKKEPKISNDVDGLSLDLPNEPVKSSQAESKADDSSSGKAPRPYELAIVVDDSRPSAAIASTLISVFGFDVLTCSDGLEAQKLISGMSEAELKRVRLVLSDFVMPRANGLDLLTFVRRHPSLGLVAFIMFSSHSEDELVHKVRALTANAFVAKPLSFQKLRQALCEAFPHRSFPEAPPKTS